MNNGWIKLHRQLQDHWIWKKPEQLNLSQSNPPHTIVAWRGGDKQPTDAEINKGWTDYKAAQAAVKY